MEFDNLFDINKYPHFPAHGLEPADDGPCLCLSGEKYINCCKNKIAESKVLKASKNYDDGLDELFGGKESKLPSRKLAAKVIKKKKLGYCMASDVFHDCSCMNNSTEADIRYSHTLSRGFVLTNLCDSNRDMVTYINDHIMTNDKSIKLADRFYEIPIKEASVTTSFCKKHDDYLFEDIEKIDKRAFTGSFIQNIEYALKAVAFEMFEAVMYIYYLASLVEQNPNVVYDNKGKSRFLDDYCTKLIRFFEMKVLSDRIIADIKAYKDTGVESNLKTINIRIKKHSRVEYSLAEVFEDDYFLNVVNAPEPYIIFSYYPDIYEYDTYLKDCVLKLKTKQNERTIRDFTDYVLTYSRNVYFNSDMIKRMQPSDLDKLYIVHREGFRSLKSEQTIFSMRMVSKLYT